MKKIIFTIGSYLLATLLVSAQTNVPGGNVNGTWTLVNSPYLINGSITVPNDSSLTIEPGVVLEFQGYYSLNVQGRLLAIGTLSDTIIFTINDTTGFTNMDTTAGGWLGIRFNTTPASNDTSKIIYCKIEYGKAYGPGGAYESGGAIYIKNFSKVKISNCKFINNRARDDGAAIYQISGGNLSISNCTFTNNYDEGFFGGGGIISGNNLTLLNNTISNNYAPAGAITCEGYINLTNNEITNNSNYAIYAFSTNFLIQNNTIINNGRGIYLFQDSHGLLENNNISNNQGSGIRLWGNDYQFGDLIIQNNIITYNVNSGINFVGASSHTEIVMNNFITNNTATNGAGIYLVSSFSKLVRVINNVICNNEASNQGGGIYCNNYGMILNNTIANNKASNGGGIYALGDPIITNCIIWGNIGTSGGNQIAKDFLASPTYSYCDIQSGNTNNGNINNNPQFVSQSAGVGASFDGLNANWVIQSTSPCINSGKPDTTGLDLPLTDIVGNPRITNDTIDIGAYEYNYPPIANFSANTTIITAGDNVIFMDLSSNFPIQWSWSFPGGTPDSSSQQNPTITYNTSGIYDVTLTATNTFGSNSNTKTGYITVGIIGVSEFVEISNIKLYPNPYTGEFILEMNVLETQDIQVKITNIIGKEVYAEKLKQINGFYHKTIDMKGYTVGIYQLQISTNEGIINRKIIKQ